MFGKVKDWQRDGRKLMSLEPNDDQQGESTNRFFEALIE